MTHFNAPAYDIERPTGQCAFTGRVLQPKESYIATLVEVPLEEGKASLGLKRLDVSLEAWEQGRRPGNLFSYWKCVVAEPNAKKKLFVDDDVLLNLFRRLCDSDQEERRAFHFVLMLILMRKRLLRYEGTIKRQDAGGAGQEWWRMKGKPVAEGAEAETYEVINPHLDEQQVARVTQQLGEILEAEL